MSAGTASSDHLKWLRHSSIESFMEGCPLETLRRHHFQRWYSGGSRNLIGLLPRARYKLSSSRREMRSMMHQRGMDAMVAHLYATAGRGLLTVLDGRLLARQDEHLPLRFTRLVPMPFK
jgi:hypothetical protein